VIAGHLAALQRMVSRLGGGKAVDYAEIEQTMAEVRDARSLRDIARFCRAWILMFLL
jgi:hypothetical protein